MSTYVRQTGSLSLPITAWLVLSGLSLLCVLAIIGAPWAMANGYSGTAQTIYRAFSHFCHQLPDRSYFTAGHPLAVCARCTGIYFGFGLAALAYPLVRSLRQVTTPPRKWLFVAAAPLAIDWAIEFFGIWPNSHSSRLLTGALLSATAVLYIMPGLMDLALRDWKPSSKPTNQQLTFTTIQRADAPSDYSAPERRI